jgi:hypothetical protein
VGVDGLGEKGAEVFVRIRGHAKQFTFLVEVLTMIRTVVAPIK